MGRISDCGAVVVRGSQTGKKSEVVVVGQWSVGVGALTEWCFNKS